jgi:hypothetical protein
MKTAETLSESSRIIVYTNFAGLPILRVIIDPTGPSYTYSLVDPVTLTNLDKDGRTFDQITSKRTTGSGALSPTDTFAQTDWQSWTDIQYDNQHRTIGGRVYFKIPSSGVGTVGAVSNHLNPATNNHFKCRHYGEALICSVGSAVSRRWELMDVESAQHGGTSGNPRSGAAELVATSHRC